MATYASASSKYAGTATAGRTGEANKAAAAARGEIFHPQSFAEAQGLKYGRVAKEIKPGVVTYDSNEEQDARDNAIYAAQKEGSSYVGTPKGYYVDRSGLNLSFKKEDEYGGSSLGASVSREQARLQGKYGYTPTEQQHKQLERNVLEYGSFNRQNIVAEPERYGYYTGRTGDEIMKDFRIKAEDYSNEGKYGTSYGYGSQSLMPVVRELHARNNIGFGGAMGGWMKDDTPTNRETILKYQANEFMQNKGANNFFASGGVSFKSPTLKFVGGGSLKEIFDTKALDKEWWGKNVENIMPGGIVTYTKTIEQPKPLTREEQAIQWRGQGVYDRQDLLAAGYNEKYVDYYPDKNQSVSTWIKPPPQSSNEQVQANTEAVNKMYASDIPGIINIGSPLITSSNKQTQSTIGLRDYIGGGIESGINLVGSLNPLSYIAKMTSEVSPISSVTNISDWIYGTNKEIVGNLAHGVKNAFIEGTTLPWKYDEGYYKTYYNLSEKQFENLPLTTKLLIGPKTSFFNPQIRDVQVNNINDFYAGEAKNIASTNKQSISNLQDAIAAGGSIKYTNEKGANIVVSDKQQLGDMLIKLQNQPVSDLSSPGFFKGASLSLGFSQPQTLGEEKYLRIGNIESQFYGFNLKTAEYIGGGILVGGATAVSLAHTIAPTQLGGSALTYRAGMAYSGIQGMAIIPNIKITGSVVDTLISRTPSKIFEGLSMATPPGLAFEVMSSSDNPWVAYTGGVGKSIYSSGAKEATRLVGYYYGMKVGTSLVDSLTKDMLPTTTKVTRSLQRYSTGGINQDESLRKLTYEINSNDIARSTRFLGTSHEYVTDVNMFESKLLSKSVINTKVAMSGFYDTTSRFRGYDFEESGLTSGRQINKVGGIEVFSSNTKIPMSSKYSFDNGQNYYDTKLPKPFTSYYQSKTNPFKGTSMTLTYKNSLYGPSLSKYNPPTEARSPVDEIYAGRGESLSGNVKIPAYNVEMKYGQFAPITSFGGGGGGFTGKGVASAYEQGMQHKLEAFKAQQMRDMFAMDYTPDGYAYAYFVGELPAYSMRNIPQGAVNPYQQPASLSHGLSSASAAAMGLSQMNNYNSGYTSKLSVGSLSKLITKINIADKYNQGMLTRYNLANNLGLQNAYSMEQTNVQMYGLGNQYNMAQKYNYNYNYNYNYENVNIGGGGFGGGLFTPMGFIPPIGMPMGGGFGGFGSRRRRWKRRIKVNPIPSPEAMMGALVGGKWNIGGGVWGGLNLGGKKKNKKKRRRKR